MAFHYQRSKGTAAVFLMAPLGGLHVAASTKRQPTHGDRDFFFLTEPGGRCRVGPSGLMYISFHHKGLMRKVSPKKFHPKKWEDSQPDPHKKKNAWRLHLRSSLRVTQGITFLDILKEEIKIKSLQNDIFQLNLLDQNLIFTSISIQFQITLYLIFIHIPILEPNKSFKKNTTLQLDSFRNLSKKLVILGNPNRARPAGFV